METAGEHERYHLGHEQLAEGMRQVRQSPAEGGAIELLVIRPDVDQRMVLPECDVDAEHGLVGDTWRQRGNRRTPDGASDPDDQITVMNSRVALLVAGSWERVPLAGDQVYVDLDLSRENLPTGTVLDFGEVALEVADKPHTGCKKFAARFGLDALRLTADDEGRERRLRGINVRVVQGGRLRVGDTVTVRRPGAGSASG
jgi:hypothetical protein